VKLDKKQRTHNTAFAKMAGEVYLELFLHLTKFCARRQICAFYPPSSQSLIVSGKQNKPTEQHELK